jgi:hypothetical protein
MGAVGDRWIRLSGNLVTDSVESFMTIVREAKASGADTVLFSDTKTSNFYAGTLGQSWLNSMLEFQSAVRAEGMAFIVTTASVGYCQPILQMDQSLVNTMPAVDMPLTVQGGQLVPQQTAMLANGSFEAAGSEANKPADWGFQDSPGVTTFLDSSVAAEGATSMRFEGANSTSANKMGRISTTAQVQPNQQYVLRYKFKADALNAGFIGPVVRGEGTDVSLTNQHPSFVRSDGGRSYTQGADNLTTDWVEMELSFNSREFSSVSLFFGSWSTRSGVQWIDDVRIEAEPTLNIVRRDSLPVTLKKADGTPLTEGVDVAPISDPQLGTVPFPGSYESYHDAPPVTVASGSSLVEGDTVLMSAYHATITSSGQVGCSWNEPRTFELMKETHRQVAEVIKPDGILIDVEETRTGGWEPADTPFGTSGAAFANHVSTVVNDAHSVVGGIPLFMWNDMLDPTMNATADFYQVKGTLDQSWVGIDPAKVRIVNWRSDEKLRDLGDEGVKHFADLGYEQILAGFYDEDVADNHAAWTAASAGQPGIVGTMYTTWTDDFTQIDEFAALWWTD